MKNNFEITEDLAYLLGVIGGDGTIHITKGKQYTVSISDKYKDFHTKTLEPILIKELNHKPDIKFIRQRNTWYSTIRSKQVTEFINRFYSAGRNKTYSDRVPEIIRNAENESIILSHIAGWVDSEGTSFTKIFKTKYGIYKYPCVKIELVDTNFLQDLQHLSDKTSIPSTKVMYVKRNYREDQIPRHCICWNGIAKCSKISKFMRHPLKRNVLNSRISSSRRPI